MDKEFILEFLDFVQINNVKTKSDYQNITIMSDTNEIATINENGTLSINFDNKVSITKDFISLLLDYDIKFSSVFDKKYNIWKGVALSNDKGLCLTITSDKIILPTGLCQVQTNNN